MSENKGSRLPIEKRSLFKTARVFTNTIITKIKSQNTASIRKKIAIGTISQKVKCSKWFNRVAKKISPTDKMNSKIAKPVKRLVGFTW